MLKLFLKAQKLGWLNFHVVEFLHIFLEAVLVNINTDMGKWNIAVVPVRESF